MSETTVTIVGAGMSGAACLLALRRAGVAARLVDRGRAPGGRMASPLLHDRRVDTGAGYFTVRDDDFGALVDDWAARGLAHEWTDTFTVLRAGAEPESKSGPTRWGTPGGLRSLVRDLLRDVPVEQTDVDVLPAGHVVLAMPDPQASRLTEVPDAVPYDPVITVVLGLATASSLPFADAAFVQDDPDVEFLAVDGARRGDGAPVLVAHTTAERARRHLDDPDSAVAPVVDAVRRLTGIAPPEWTHAHRWTYAKPSASHEASFGLVERDGRLIGFAGDQWCPEGSPRVESAWRSGSDLGAALAERLGA
ncbi:NAD(P)/FAD-dependent oxidoreductase [Rhodococcoides corynebacterioides]|uniref:NAD(P)/FAD-dependent oxidoreductase n=1 Tax=Rhodococcoides corynebacterioides TaxID=53972 RepID=UPI0027E102E2|nr:NAD(P)-binding protein [Rhodococcus corynebacterioides]